MRRKTRVFSFRLLVFQHDDHGIHPVGDVMEYYSEAHDEADGCAGLERDADGNPVQKTVDDEAPGTDPPHDMAMEVLAISVIEEEIPLHEAEDEERTDDQDHDV